MSSLNFISHRIGVIAERMDEFGTDFMGHVDLYEDPALNATLSRPFEANLNLEDTLNQNGLYSLPIELQHLIILHMKPKVEDLVAISLVNRYVSF